METSARCRSTSSLKRRPAGRNPRARMPGVRPTSIISRNQSWALRFVPASTDRPLCSVRFGAPRSVTTPLVVQRLSAVRVAVTLVTYDKQLLIVRYIHEGHVTAAARVRPFLVIGGRMAPHTGQRPA